MIRNSKLKATQPVDETDAWAKYVSQMAELGMTVQFGVATHDRFYERAMGTALRNRQRRVAS